MTTKLDISEGNYYRIQRDISYVVQLRYVFQNTPAIGRVVLDVIKGNGLLIPNDYFSAEINELLPLNDDDKVELL